ncbi:MAG: hypothetical protein RLY20_3285 [Verrucomicrobiota bacterium]
MREIKRMKNSRAYTSAFTLLELMLVVAALAAMAFIFLQPMARPKVHGCGINCVNSLKQVGVSFRIWASDNGDKFPMGVAATNGGPAQQSAITDGTGAAYVYQVFQVMSNELGTPKIVCCPADGDRNPATNFGGHFTDLGNIGISYFVGKNADELNPNQYLAGDRNIGVKPASGWAGKTGDGSVTGFSPNVGRTGNFKSLLAYQKDPNLQWTDKIHQGKGNVCLADGSVQQMTSARMRAGITNVNDGTWIYFP